MAIYKKKPEYIEAAKFRDDLKSIEEITAIVNGEKEVTAESIGGEPILNVGGIRFHLGAYIIRDSNGTLGVMMEDFFEEEYELAEG